MEWGELATQALAIVGAAVSGGAANHYFGSKKAASDATAAIAQANAEARTAEADARAAEATAAPKDTAAFNKLAILLTNRVQKLEQDRDAKDARIDQLQDRVHSLELELATERNQCREDLAAAKAVTLAQNERIEALEEALQVAQDQLDGALAEIAELKGR